MSARIKIIEADTNGNAINEYMYTSITVEEAADTTTGKAQTIDTFARALVGLTTNTYKDTELIETKSITEILAE